ncbi:hypothetical protein HK096_007693, partial [Nowakowskiella sp. JEL0078]
MLLSKKALILSFLISWCSILTSSTKLHVLLTSLPASHYVPLLPIAIELIDRGHNVTLAFGEQVFKSIPNIPGANKLVLPNINLGVVNRKNADRMQMAFKIPHVISPLFVNFLPLFSLPSKSKDSPSKKIIDHVNSLSDEDKPNVILNANFLSFYAFDAADALKMNSAVLTLLGPELFLSGSSPYPKSLLPFSVTDMTFSESVINAFYQQLELMDIGIKVWGIVRKIVYGNPIFWNMNDMFENRLVLMSTTPEFSPSEGLPSRCVYIGASILPGNVSMGRNRITLGETQNEKEIVKKDIITWMNEKYEANIDVVYVAFGTVAVPSTADIIKILNGLASKK